MIVTLLIAAEKKTSKTATATSMVGYYGYGPGYGWGAGHSVTTIQEYDSPVGTLVCDVLDDEKDVLVLEGIGTKTLVEDPAPGLLPGCHRPPYQTSAEVNESW